ncbi:MAG: periplasmic sensor signal transduction histidine kinase [Acidimicrobiia bacterium]|nr:periplasmic sensor signal transduction histidine kinase [Acidimicrobiia bacterium]
MVALVGVSVLAVGFASYRALGSYLLDQADKNLDQSVPSARRILLDQQPDPTGQIRRRQLFPNPNYVEVRDSAGAVVGSPVRAEQGLTEEPAPRLPKRTPGDVRHRFTVGAASGSLRYRVLTIPVATVNGDPPGTLIIAAPLRDEDSALRRLLLIELAAGAIVLAILVVVARQLVGVGLRPLVEMETTTAQIAAGDFSARVKAADDRTEVGRLGNAFNTMVSQIEAAFGQRQITEDRLRRFVADASHELRTPLTSIRGYSELYRHGALAQPDDLERAMSRIEQEAARMGLLVEDLLLLARLDEHRPFDKRPVDLSRLLADAVNDSRAVEPNRPIALIDEAPGALVLGDVHRLHQVVANLLANVRVHTPPDAEVEIRLGFDDSQAIITVHDSGPGMAPDVAANVFERFYRADPSRARASGNAGLGLAIVAAIVEAHDGTVSVETAPGKGATFTVRLPRAGLPAPQLPVEEPVGSNATMA